MPGKQAVFLIQVTMKQILPFIILLLTGCTTTKMVNKTQSRNGVIAHRGAFKKQGLPENSIASLQEAIRLGCAGSEFDIRMTADDSLIIFHDAHYRQLDIEQTTYAQLTQVPLANGEPIPTLQAYLKAGLQNNKTTRLILEVKPSASKERGLQIAEKVVQLVRMLKAEPMVAYISFDYDILKKIIALDPAAETQYLNGDRTPAQLKADGIAGADYHLSVYKKNPAWIKEAKAENRVLNAWTVNAEADMKWLLENGFQLITTDEPELLLNLWSSYAKSPN